jgi:hypothetical protein
MTGRFIHPARARRRDGFRLHIGLARDRMTEK